MGTAAAAMTIVEEARLLLRRRRLGGRRDLALVVVGTERRVLRWWMDATAGEAAVAKDMSHGVSVCGSELFTRAAATGPVMVWSGH